MPPNCVIIWRFADAPDEYRYSVGGDEDYVAYVPASLLEDAQGGLLGDLFSPSKSIFMIMLGNGDYLAIGTHS